METQTPQNQMQQQGTQQNRKGNAPIERHPDGDIVFKVFQNESKNGTKFYNVKPAKIYTDKQTGEFRETSNFRSDDMLKFPDLAAKSRATIQHYQQMDRENAKTQSQVQGSEQPQSQYQAPLEQNQQTTRQHGQDMTAERDQAMAQAAPVQAPTQPEQVHDLERGPER